MPAMIPGGTSRFIRLSHTTAAAAAAAAAAVVAIVTALLCSSSDSASIARCTIDRPIIGHDGRNKSVQTLRRNNPHRGPTPVAYVLRQCVTFYVIWQLFTAVPEVKYKYCIHCENIVKSDRSLEPLYNVQVMCRNLQEAQLSRRLGHAMLA